MAKITRAFAFANNEVAFLAWDLDVHTIPGCLGFHIVREYLDKNDKVIGSRPLAAYVAFRGQRNPDWFPQNTGVWPVQKFTWRDLTLRKRRDKATRRRLDDRVRYQIRAVGHMAPGLEAVEVVEETHKDSNGQQVSNGYEGKPVPLGYLTKPAWTNAVDVTTSRPPFTSTFTNGILSTQFLVKVLKEDGVLEPGELEAHLRKPDDFLRNYLSGDVIPTMREFFDQEGGRFHAALYELEDEELVQLLVDQSPRIDLILSDAGSSSEDDEEGDGKTTTYDSRNAPARKKLRKLARSGKGLTLQDRLFNGTGHIGHNKFVVFVNDAGAAKSVLTGSTNWTWSGVAGQSNNCVRIDNDDIATAYFEYWKRLQADAQPTPKPLSARNTGAGQGDDLKTADMGTAAAFKLEGGGFAEVWFSPNVPGRNAPPSASAAKQPPPPPDMARLFSLMRKAHRSVFFLVFMPSRGGVNSIVSEAVSLGQKDPALDIVGAISDTQAMWGYKPGSKDDQTGKKVPASSPHVFQQGGVSVVRATALTDREIARPLGDFKLEETLTLGRAIIHDKVLVIDPMDPKNCVVAFGSHNFGYKASYSNDENLVIVRGHQGLALAYAAHILDVYDHYRFRAVEAEQAQKKKSSGTLKTKEFEGFLCTDDSWQAKASRRLSRYFTGK